RRRRLSFCCCCRLHRLGLVMGAGCVSLTRSFGRADGLIGRDGRATLLPFEAIIFALQAHQPTRGLKCGAPTSADGASTPRARSGGGNDDHTARDAGAMASRGLSPLLALEISEPGRPATNRCGSAGMIRQMSIENVLWGAPRIQGEAWHFAMNLGK